MLIFFSNSVMRETEREGKVGQAGKVPDPTAEAEMKGIL